MARCDAESSERSIKLLCHAVYCCLFFAPFSLRAETSGVEDIVVTATRVPEPADQIPAAISVVSGTELRERGATGMASALNLLSGVEAPPGGDAGPSSAVPSFWGLHEFDAFLLVVDGVPWGGAYNPSITTLDFTDVERVEVLKGAAPVMYGATSFVGVVHAIHYPAGEAANEADWAYGSYGSVRGSASLVLPQIRNYRQSIAIDGQEVGYPDPRERVVNQRVLYRGALDVESGKFTLDADVTRIRDLPPSPVLRASTGLTALTTINANFNPADARVDEDQYHLALGYSRPTALGIWESRISYAYSDIADVRAFLHPDLSGSADSQNQRRYIGDGYVDSHLSNGFLPDATLIVGADVLYGHGRQTTLNGNSGYTVTLDGAMLPPPISSIPVTEIGTVDDHRLFAGQYAQVDWKLGARWDVIGGIRLNEAYEHKTTSDLVLPPLQLAVGDERKTMIRPTETVGVSYRAWSAGKDEAVVFADVRNAFKPAAIDFGPDFTPNLLSPETTRSYEFGVKGAVQDGHFSYQAALFQLNFHNLVVRTDSGALANAAGEKLKGAEAEVRYQVTNELRFAGSASYHDATFTKYLFFDGLSDVDVAGRRLTLSPHVLASGGLLYTPSRGLFASAVARYVGRRFLDPTNQAAVGGYSTFDANLGYGFGRVRLSLEGVNLSNQRPPVTSSEFGSQSFYLLPARMTWIRIRYSWA